MMINKRLISAVPESKKYIGLNVLFQWFSLLANCLIILVIANYMEELYQGKFSIRSSVISGVLVLCALLFRYLCLRRATKMSFLSSKSVKSSLRQLIYEKLLRLGLSYREKVSTAEVVQVAVEGVEQLETYFGAYLPQFFYSMLAPLTLFVLLSFISVNVALVLLLCVPLIPLTIAAVQSFAKKLFAKYWGEYTSLGDSFLENLQGLTTLKIYQSDGYKQEKMNQGAERFRKITMKVLTMQLNSIVLMDTLAYGGAALGVILATRGLSRGDFSLGGALAIILLSAEFYIPMRLLGSFFHIAMNGMASSEKIFKLLDLEEESLKGSESFPEDTSIRCKKLSFSYEEKRQILKDIDLYIPKGSFSAIIGESGSGKSTIASILMGRNRDYRGSVMIGKRELRDLDEKELMKGISYVGHESYLFKGTVRENLSIAIKEPCDDMLWSVLERVQLADFLRSEEGLDTLLYEGGSNFSGGQRQRLSLARALLHDSPIYIFDEATSNVDVESEKQIMHEIRELSKTGKTVILITHCLANATAADRIYTLETGEIKELGSHQDLLQNQGTYRKLWDTQQALMAYVQGESQ